MRVNTKHTNSTRGTSSYVCSCMVWYRMYFWWSLCTLYLHVRQQSYRRRLRSFLLYFCYVFRAQTNILSKPPMEKTVNSQLVIFLILQLTFSRQKKIILLMQLPQSAGTQTEWVKQNHSFGEWAKQKQNHSFGEWAKQKQNRSFGEWAKQKQNCSFGEWANQKKNYSFGERAKQKQNHSFRERAKQNRSFGEWAKQNRSFVSTLFL